MRALLLVRHGPELRLLKAIQNSGRYADIVLLIDSNAADEVQLYVNDKVQCLLYQRPKVTKLKRWATYLSALMDSLARRVNRQRGIGHYSYAKRSKQVAKNSSSRITRKINLTHFCLGPALRIFAIGARFLFCDRSVQEVLMRSGCEVLVVCDHLGGSDSVAYNAQQLGLEVHYFLNNHKDLSIRPYVPLPASHMFTWFECQRAVVLDVCGSHSKLLPIGLLRAGSLLESVANLVQKPSDGIVRVLHCCADARRRPYELQSLFRIFTMVRELKLPLNFTLRQNPMGPAIDVSLFAEFNFVDVVGHGWHWDAKKFLNFPDVVAEAAYARQLTDHDVISALPSTTLVEGYFFTKPIICLLDQSSSDANWEREELALCVPECVLTAVNSVIVRSPKEYVDVLLEISSGK